MRRIRFVLDCGDIVEPTVETLGEICRFKLDAGRAGCDLELRDVRPSLIELLNLAGLAALLLEGEGQAEQREQPGGVEEEGELLDPPAL